MKISKTSIYAVIPLICSGIFFALTIYEDYQLLILKTEPSNTIPTLIFFILSWFLWLLLFTVGIMKKFPSWTVHSISYAFIMTLYKAISLKPVGGWSILPLIIAIIIGLKIRLSNKCSDEPELKNKRSVTDFLFLFYGLLPFILAAGYDSTNVLTNRLSVVPIYLGLILIVTICTLIYLNSKNITVRIVSVIMGIALPITISVITHPYTSIYYN